MINNLLPIVDMLDKFLGSTTTDFFKNVHFINQVMFVNNEYSYLILNNKLWKNSDKYSIDLLDLQNGLKIFNKNDVVNIVDNTELKISSNNGYIVLEKQPLQTTIPDLSDKPELCMEILLSDLIDLFNTNSNIGSPGDDTFTNVAFNNNGKLILGTSTNHSFLVSYSDLLNDKCSVNTSFKYAFMRHFVKTCELINIKDATVKIFVNNKYIIFDINDDIKIFYLKHQEDNFNNFKQLANYIVEAQGNLITQLDLQSLKDKIKKLYTATNKSYFGNFIELSDKIYFGYKKNTIETKLNLDINTNRNIHKFANFISMYKFLNTLTSSKINLVEYFINDDTYISFENNNNKFVVI